MLQCIPEPVSYTHLDVYKRQVSKVNTCVIKSTAHVLNNVETVNNNLSFGKEPVSDTHLDVYKRQCLKLLKKLLLNQDWFNQVITSLSSLVFLSVQVVQTQCVSAPVSYTHLITSTTNVRL